MAEKYRENGISAILNICQNQVTPSEGKQKEIEYWFVICILMSWYICMGQSRIPCGFWLNCLTLILFCSVCWAYQIISFDLSAPTGAFYITRHCWRFKADQLLFVYSVSWNNVTTLVFVDIFIKNLEFLLNLTSCTFLPGLTLILCCSQALVCMLGIRLKLWDYI